MSESSNCSGEDTQLNLTNKFNEITYWNLDCNPSSNDKIVQAMKWIDISQAVSLFFSLRFQKLLLLITIMWHPA